MDDIKREELEKACKNYKVRTRMVAVRMVLVCNMTVEETANLQVHCPTWVRDWLRRYDEGGLEGLRDLPRCGRPRRILRNAMDEIITNVADCRITPMGLQPVHTGADRHEISHYVHPKDHAPVQPVPKGSTKDPRQPGRQAGRQFGTGGTTSNGKFRA